MYCRVNDSFIRAKNVGLVIAHFIVIDNDKDNEETVKKKRCRNHPTALTDYSPKQNLFQLLSVTRLSSGCLSEEPESSIQIMNFCILQFKGNELNAGKQR